MDFLKNSLIELKQEVSTMTSFLQAIGVVALLLVVIVICVVFVYISYLLGLALAVVALVGIVYFGISTMKSHT